MPFIGTNLRINHAPCLSHDLSLQVRDCSVDSQWDRLHHNAWHRREAPRKPHTPGGASVDCLCPIICHNYRLQCHELVHYNARLRCVSQQQSVKVGSDSDVVIST